MSECLITGFHNSENNVVSQYTLISPEITMIIMHIKSRNDFDVYHSVYDCFDIILATIFGAYIKKYDKNTVCIITKP